MRYPSTIIKGEDYEHVVATGFGVLVDDRPANGMSPVIGLMVTPVRGDAFIMPIRYEAAAEIAQHTLQTLSRVAPHLLLNLLQK